MSGAGASVRVRLPAQLQVLASVPAEVELTVAGPVTQRAVLDALESVHPALAGTLRERPSGRRRAFIRFFVEERDLSDIGPDELLPAEVVARKEPFVIVGAIAGG